MFSSKIRSLTIVGHTDDEGKRSANERLSANRARSIKLHLMNSSLIRGAVVAGALIINSDFKTSEEPLEDVKKAKDEDGARACNRRTEVKATWNIEKFPTYDPCPPKKGS